MDINELKVGDILLFSPEKGSFISWAITFLTDAPVSHAAMFYNMEDKTLIEETPPQVKVNFAPERFKGREIYVRRLKDPGTLPLSAVVDCATKYLNEKEPYDHSSLYMVGLLLLYRKFTPDTMVQKAMIKILKKLTSSIIKYIHEKENPGKLPMVCSQFVAQCYDDAGDKYRLKIESGVLKQIMAAQQSGSVLDQVMEVVKNGKGETDILQTLLAPETVFQQNFSSDEELCRELKEAFESATDAEAAGLSDDLVEAASQFSHAQYILDTGRTQLQNIGKKDPIDLLLHLKNNENIYVFPGDILKHCTNVKNVGTIK